jgi:hypothetical protein
VRKDVFIYLSFIVSSRAVYLSVDYFFYSAPHSGMKD